MYDFEVLCVPVLAVEGLCVSVLDVAHRHAGNLPAPPARLPMSDQCPEQERKQYR